MNIVKRSFAIITLITALVALSACQTTPPSSPQPAQPENVQTSRLTPSTVKSFIVKGVTTEADIKNYFGAPSLTTQNAAGLAVWSYNRVVSSSSNSSDSHSSLVIFGIGVFKPNTSTATQSFDLIITFNAKDVVQDYTMTTSS